MVTKNPDISADAEAFDKARQAMIRAFIRLRASDDVLAQEIAATAKAMRLVIDVRGPAA